MPTNYVSLEIFLLRIQVSLTLTYLQATLRVTLPAIVEAYIYRKLDHLRSSVTNFQATKWEAFVAGYV